MANYANLKATINANIKANGAEEITGPILNNVLNAAVNALGAGWQYMGVATPATSPGTPDANVFYIASTAGTYTNFGGLAVADGEVAILKWNGSWTKEVTGAATAAQVTQLGQELNGNVTKEISWSNGYVQASTGVVRTSTLSKFSQPFLLKAGEKVTIGTQNSNIGIICSTNADSVAVGDTVTVIKHTSSSGQFETYEYTAEADIKIVLCVLASNYNLSFYDTDNLTEKVGNAATKQELNSLGQDLAKLDGQINGYPAVVFSKSDYELQAGLITGGVFRSNSVYGTKNKHVLIPMTENRGRTIRLATVSGHYSNTIAFLTTDALVSGESAPYCSGTSDMYTDGDYTVPEDCVCLYVYAEREGADSFPSLTMLAIDPTAESLGAVPINQGIGNAGRPLVVGADGKVAPGTATPSTVDGDAVRKVLSRELHLGADLASVTTMGTGWSGSVANGFTHASGNTDPLVLNPTTNGNAYLVTINCDTNAENLYLVSIGDGPLLDPYNGTTQQRVGIISDGGAVKITPSSSFAGTMTIKVQECVAEEDATETVILDVYNVEAENMGAAITAFWNVAVGPGQSTLGKAVSASRNIAIGINSLPNLETGTRNIGIGTFAMSQLKNGLGNIAIGADANFLRQSGNDNIAIGRASLGGSKSESTNNGIFIGVVAGSQAVGDDNIAIGKSAGYKAAGGCVYVGSNAGFSFTGAKNVAIGINAGYQTGTITGNWNTLVGPTTSCANGVSKAVAIGYNSHASKTGQNVIGSTDSVETKVFGDLVVHGMDGIDRRIVFNNDHSVTWEAVE